MLQQRARDQVVPADGSVAAAGDDPHRQVGPRDGEAGGDRGARPWIGACRRC
jgi:hypothetical protein